MNWTAIAAGEIASVVLALVLIVVPIVAGALGDRHQHGNNQEGAAADELG